MVTYSELFLFGTFVISLISLIYQITKKKQPPQATNFSGYFNQQVRELTVYRQCPFLFLLYHALRGCQGFYSTSNGQGTTV